MNFVEELKWRGMIHDLMPGIEEQFSKEVTSAYIGFDPTPGVVNEGNNILGLKLVYSFSTSIFCIACI